jgi:hypothetical protein
MCVNLPFPAQGSTGSSPPKGDIYSTARNVRKTSIRDVSFAQIADVRCRLTERVKSTRSCPQNL